MKRIMAVILLASLAWAVKTYVACPVDGEDAAFTGSKRDSGKSCEYRHQHAVKGGFVEHRFWVKCED